MTYTLPFSLCFLHSLKMVCVSYSTPLPSCATLPSAVLTTTLLTQNTDKMLLTTFASHSSTGESNVLSFSSSLAVNPAHVFVEEIKKSTQNKSTRNGSAINFCLLLASLGKFNKVNFLSCNSVGRGTPRRAKRCMRISVVLNHTRNLGAFGSWLEEP